MPNKDLYVSKHHAIFNPKENKFMLAKDISKETDNSQLFVEYYHITLPDYENDNLIANGTIVESYTNKSRAHKQKLVTTYSYTL